MNRLCSFSIFINSTNKVNKIVFLKCFMQINKSICDKLQDQEIVRKSLTDLDYFSCLYDRYGARLLQYIRKISSVNHEEAEDILQESLINVWRNLNEYDSSLKFSSWIYRIVHNETISFYRKKHSYGKENTIELDKSNIDTLHSDFDICIEHVDTQQLTNKILNKIPIKYRECIILKYFEQMSYEEISDILKIPEGTVAVRINRAKKIFKKIAEDEHISFKQ